MTTPAPAPTPSGGHPTQTGRAAPPSMADLRRKAHYRLADRVDPVRSRHKPLSLLRQEARRLVEQFFDAECPDLPKPERDAVVEDVLAETVGVSPLEELFRDDAVKEILVLTPAQVIVRKGDVWLPASVQFRDDAQLRGVLGRLADAGESLVPGPPAAGGFDIRLANGFRAMAVLPPRVMDIPPMVVFARAAFAPTPPAQAGGVTVPGSGLFAVGAKPAATPSGTRLGTTPTPPRPAGDDSGVLARPSGAVPTVPGTSSGVNADPLARVRHRVTQRIINQLAAAGVYDLNVFPIHELRKIVAAYVHEQCESDRLGLDAAAQDRLALEIVAGMNR